MLEGATLPTVVDDGVSENPLAYFAEGQGYVGYHGTSSVYSESIERNGLSHLHLPFSYDDCATVVALFSRLHWFGWRDDPIVGGGIAVLGPWGPSRDVRLSGHRHLYLAETYARATVFANFPGGETVCALRHCIEQLVDFAGRADLRETHLEHLAGKLRRVGYSFDNTYALRHAPSVRAPSWDAWAEAIAASRDTGWLEVELERLQPPLKHLRDIVAKHRPVVYAVQIDPHGSTPDYRLRGTEFEMLSGMGIELTEPLSPSCLLAKAVPALKREPRMLRFA